MQNNDPQKVTVYGRLSYAHLFKSKGSKADPKKLRYSVNLLIDPKTDEGKVSLAKINEAIKVAGINAFGKWPHAKLVDDAGKPVDPKRFCLVSGSSFTDEDGNVRPECKGMMVLKASCPGMEGDTPPVLVDVDGRTPLKATDGKLYSGCHGGVGVRIYGTDKGGLGIFAALNAVKFKKHGEPLGGGGPARAEDYFEEEPASTDEDDI